jgi:hypothetical protein
MDILDHAEESNATSNSYPVETIMKVLEAVSIATPERYGIALIEASGIRNTMVLSEPWYQIEVEIRIGFDCKLHIHLLFINN